MWACNFRILIISPLRPVEFVIALMVMSVIRLAVGFVPVTFLAILFFGFNLWDLGLALVVFFANLFFTAWAVGMLCSGLVMRNGLGAEGLTWSMMFILLPLTCVYYPVTTLPVWVQPIAWALPPTAVFEGMRALVVDQVFRADLMWWALGLNVLWLPPPAASLIVLPGQTKPTATLIP